MAISSLSREDFVFTIGYDGPAAVIDGQGKKRFSSLSTAELAERGLFRAAYASALYSEKPEEMEALVAAYNRITGEKLSTASPLDRLFGVFPVSVSRTIVL